MSPQKVEPFSYVGSTSAKEFDKTDHRLQRFRRVAPEGTTSRINRFDPAEYYKHPKEYEDPPSPTYNDDNPFEDDWKDYLREKYFESHEEENERRHNEELSLRLKHIERMRILQRRILQEQHKQEQLKLQLQQAIAKRNTNDTTTDRSKLQISDLKQPGTETLNQGIPHRTPESVSPASNFPYLPPQFRKLVLDTADSNKADCSASEIRSTKSEETQSVRQSINPKVTKPRTNLSVDSKVTKAEKKAHTEALTMRFKKKESEYKQAKLEEQTTDPSVTLNDELSTDSLVKKKLG